MHYLDNAATTKPCPEAIAAAVNAMEQDFGNPSSLHGLGRRAEDILENARRQVAAAVGSRPEEIYFTSGGSESDNWALFSGAALMKRKGTHIITTSVEHEAVLNPCHALEKQGYEVTYLDPGQDGIVSADMVKAALRQDTVLVSVMRVNNESGAVMPLEEIRTMLRQTGSQALFHTDAVQGLMKVNCTVKQLGVDMLSMSAHKIHGVKGCGALYVRSGLRLSPYIHGGGQESGLRSGTQAVPTIAAFGAACAAESATFAEDTARMTALRQRVEREVMERIPDCVAIRGEAPHVITLCIPGCPSQPVLNLLADREIYVSAGSACSKGKRSHVLTAMGIDPKLIDCAVRVSLSRYSTDGDIDALLEGLTQARERFARPMGGKRK